MKITAKPATVQEVTITLTRAEAYVLMGVFGSMCRRELEAQIDEHCGAEATHTYLPEYLSENNPPTRQELHKAGQSLNLYFGLQDALGVNKHE